jgi:threonine dehydrogenase-like Zn-dependent dehydrogenase
MIGLYCDGASVKLRRDLPEVIPGPGEVTLRVRAVGVCDTDLQLAQGYLGFRGVIGHEFVGVDARGDRWVAEINHACRACPTCLAGRPTHCPTRTVLGIVGHDGAMAERVAVPAANLHAVPAAVSDEEAVFVEPLAAAFEILEQVRVGPDDRVAVLGDGKLGLLSAWVLRTAAERVTLLGRHRHKLALAGDGIAQRLADDAEGLARAFDVVVDATGSPSGLAAAIGLCRPRGTVVLKTTVAAPHALSLAPLVIDELTLVGSRCGPFPRALDALARKTIDVRPLLAARFPLGEAEAAFAYAAQKGVAKVILDVAP